MNLTELMTRRKTTTRDLCEKLGWSKTRVWKYQHGELAIRPIQATLIAKVLRAKASIDAQGKIKFSIPPKAKARA